MEQELIEVARKYLEINISDPTSEQLNNQLFDLAGKVNDPQTKVGKAIVAYVRAEEMTEFSMAAAEEFEEMCRAVSAAAKKRALEGLNGTHIIPSIRASFNQTG